MAENDMRTNEAATSESYSPVVRQDHATVHCECLTGRVRVTTQCWGEVALVIRRARGRAVARCEGHTGAVYRPEPSVGHGRAPGALLIEPGEEVGS